MLIATCRRARYCSGVSQMAGWPGSSPPPVQVARSTPGRLAHYAAHADAASAVLTESVLRRLSSSSLSLSLSHSDTVRQSPRSLPKCADCAIADPSDPGRR